MFRTKLIDGKIDGTDYSYVPHLVVYKGKRYVAEIRLTSVGYNGTKSDRNRDEKLAQWMIDTLNDAWSKEKL